MKISEWNMGVNIENGNKNYLEKIEQLNLKYPLGIPFEVVILICQDLEIYYLLQIINIRNEEKLLVEKFNNSIQFSNN